MKTNYESEIRIQESVSEGLLVVKKYDESCDAINQLNQLLSGLYSDDDVLPIVMHERHIYSLLEVYNITPKLIGSTKNELITKYDGKPLSDEDIEIPNDYVDQCLNILSILISVGVRHNDITLGNVLIDKNGRVKLIDFTMSEYSDLKICDGERIRDEWNYKGQDFRLINLPFLKSLNSGNKGVDMSVNEKTNSDVVMLNEIAKNIYSYHNLGVNNFPEGEEKAPNGYGERYNYDRMYQIISSYDISGKSVLDIGCNSGWFCAQAKSLGAARVSGIDFDGAGIMGGALAYARQFSKLYQLDIDYIDKDLNSIDVSLKGLLKDGSVDCVLLLSVLHHINDKEKLVDELYDVCNDAIIYEDHEFWNELYDDEGMLIPVKGEGHRWGWNTDMSWQRKMRSIEFHQELVLNNFKNSWRSKVFKFERFKNIKLIGFSEKRRPVMLLLK